MELDVERAGAIGLTESLAESRMEGRANDAVPEESIHTACQDKEKVASTSVRRPFVIKPFVIKRVDYFLITSL